MAVYTEISDEDLAAFVAAYDIGAVISCKGVAEGVENSNYLLQTDTAQFILTLYEKRVDPADLPFFLDLMDYLAARGLVCPTPVRGTDGQALRSLAGRPAALVTFLQGISHKRSTVAQCRLLGEALARLHVAGRDFPLRRPNGLSVAAWRPLFDASSARADEIKSGLAALLTDELETLEQAWPTDLPQGVIHADLFPDNVFFLGEHVSGLIDFYFACTDILAYDVAICLNAWCFEPDLSFNVTKARALMAGYGDIRPLSEAEIADLPILCRGAALRFLLTRLYDWLNTPPSAFVKRKDPMEYVRKLAFHRQIKGIGAYGL